MKYEVTHEVAQSVLNYLASRPYGEVYQLIDALKGLKPIEEVEKAKE